MWAAIRTKLPGAKTGNLRARSDHLQTVLIIARINNAYQLYEERVKLQFIVPAISGNKRDRCGCSGLNATDGAAQRSNLRTQSIQHIAFHFNAFDYFLPQMIVALWLNHTRKVPLLPALL